MKSVVKDMTGKIFSRLTVLERDWTSPVNRLRWICKCECGKTISVRGYALRSKSTKSCGCLHHIETSGKFPFNPAFNAVIAHYRCNAKARNLSFELTHDECMNLFLGTCHYCNAVGSNFEKSNKYTCLYTGIDRVNNNLGYISSNVVACCGTCNHAKKNMTASEFCSWISRISAHFFPQKLAGYSAGLVL